MKGSPIHVMRDVCAGTRPRQRHAYGTGCVSIAWRASDFAANFRSATSLWTSAVGSNGWWLKSMAASTWIGKQQTAAAVT